MGSLEIQILSVDSIAQRVLEVDADGGRNGDTVIRVAADFEEALPAVARLTPLMISIDYLLSLKTPSALGQEHFTVNIRRMEPVRFPDSRLETAPQRFDVIDMTSGDLEFSAMVAHGEGWPHVMVHRARPHQATLGPVLQRAFLAALRDAVGPLVSPDFAV